MGTARLLAAIKAAGPSPCEKYSCNRMSKCASEKLACGAFERYVRDGVATPPEINATAEIFKACDEDHTDWLLPETRAEKVQEAVEKGVRSMHELQKVWG